MAKPKTFALHWGSGVVEEEVQVEGEHHRPTVQLLRFTEGEVAGTTALRFCYYDHRGRFQRSPLIVGEAEFAMLAKAVESSPAIREHLRRLVGDN